MQFDWLKEKFDKLTCFGNICNIFYDKFGIVTNEWLFLWILTMCKLRRNSQT